MQSEVFRPSTGPLLVRGAITEGPHMSMDSYRRKDIGSRPSTQSGYRFGQLSHNAFFARHNPHPSRVRHLKGLLDVPICSVNDDGYFASPRYSLNFPPNTFDQTKMSKYGQGSSGGDVKAMSMPVNAINVNSKMHSINSITGLQNFLGKPMNFRVFREKAIPMMGMVPITDAWRDELRALTEAAGLARGNQLPRQTFRPTTEQSRPRTSQYSAATGRLIPPPSQSGSRAGFAKRLQHITEDPDQESMVLQMLCQILQTDDVNAVQSWLISAGDREKALVLDMIKSALINTEEYYKQGPAECLAAERPRTGILLSNDMAGEMLGTNDKADRLTLDGGSPAPCAPTVGLKPFQEPMIEEEITKPVLPDVFKRPGTANFDKPASRFGRPRTPGKPTTPGISKSDAKLRYTTTPCREQDMEAQKAGMNSFLDEDKVWQPDLSV